MAEVRKAEAAFVPIKPQYLYTEPDEGEVPDKKPRLEDENSSKNKARWFDRPPIHENLCRVLINIPEEGPMPVCSTMRCRFIHDVSKYLQSKPPDIAPECFVYKSKGHCPRGITCRFGQQHITETGRNMTDKKTQALFEASGLKTLNFYSRETEADLKKRTYNFRRAEEVLSNLPKPAVPAWLRQGDIDFTEDVDVTSEVPEVAPIHEERLGPCPEEDLFRLHLSEKKKIDWEDKLYLPALPNFGNLPFRRICKEYGADVTCSEPLIAANILEGSVFDWLLARRHESEDMFGVQLHGSNPFVLTRCAQLMDEKTNADFVDLHFGNPGDPMRFMRKSGSPTRRVKAVETVVRCLSRVTHLPLTISTRLCDSDQLSSCYKSCQVSLVSLVGRTKDTREVDWEGVNELATELSPVPCMSSSDVISCYDYFSLREQFPQLAGVIISRGALVKPWIFGELKQKRDWDITSNERFEMLRRYVHYGLDHWGSDAKGVEVTRRFLLDWLSFLCRYIPFGLLEQPPQKLNDKCARYIGRDDMETLLGSHNQQDWIKVSEMLLGPVPEGFQFVPKVKQGFWPLDS